MKINIEKDEDMPNETRYVVHLYDYLETPYIEREEILKNADCPTYMSDPRVRKFIVESISVQKYDSEGKHIYADDDEDELGEESELRMYACDGNTISFEIVSSRDRSKMTFIVDEFRLMSALTEIMRMKHTD